MRGNSRPGREFEHRWNGTDGVKDPLRYAGLVDVSFILPESDVHFEAKARLMWVGATRCVSGPLCGDRTCFVRAVAALDQPQDERRRLGFLRLETSVYLPNGVEHRSIDPFHDRDGTIPVFWPARSSATDRSTSALISSQRTNRQVRFLHCIDKILAPWIDGDAALGRDDVDQFARATESLPRRRSLECDRGRTAQREWCSREAGSSASRRCHAAGGRRNA